MNFDFKIKPDLQMDSNHKIFGLNDIHWHLIVIITFSVENLELIYVDLFVQMQE